MLGIENATKPILGAVLMEIKDGNNILILKCFVVDNMNYHIVLGRDMLDH